MAPCPCAYCGGTCERVCDRLRTWQSLPDIGYDDEQGHARFTRLESILHKRGWSALVQAVLEGA